MLIDDFRLAIERGESRKAESRKKPKIGGSYSVLALTLDFQLWTFDFRVPSSRSAALPSNSAGFQLWTFDFRVPSLPIVNPHLARDLATDIGTDEVA